MHLSDTLVFGPLYPLLPQPVRVRLGALLVGLVGLVGGLGILTVAGVVLVLGPAALPASARSLLPGWASPAEPNATTQQIRVTSNPAGAVCLVRRSSSWNSTRNRPKRLALADLSTMSRGVPDKDEVA